MVDWGDIFIWVGLFTTGMGVGGIMGMMITWQKEVTSGIDLKKLEGL